MQTVTTANEGRASKRPILVPVDFSPCSRAALAFGLQMASWANVPLQALHVIHEPSYEPGFYRRRDNAGPFYSITDAASHMLERFLADLTSDGKWRAELESTEPLLVQGLPASRIQEVAVQQDAAMIILGSHGRQGLTRLLLGSVADLVARQSRIPVTIIRAGEHGCDNAMAYQMGSPTWWTRHAPADDAGPEANIA